MPRASSLAAAPIPRVPRTLFAHAHRDQDMSFPVELHAAINCIAYTIIPDNWNGLDALILWLIGAGTEQLTITVTIDIGTCTEVYNIHTQTVAAINKNMVASTYACIDLTALFAVVLANLAVRDILRVSVIATTMDNTSRMIGIELQET